MFFISPLFFGFLAAAGALLAELFVLSFFIQNPSVYSATTANTNFVLATGGILFLFLSACIEECFKYLLLKKTFSTEYSRTKNILFLFFFCIGFSGLEISLLVFDNPIINSVVATHITGVFLIHLTTILLFGYSLSKESLKKFSLLFIPIATLIHFLYNVAILYQDTLHI